MTKTYTFIFDGNVFKAQDYKLCANKPTIILIYLQIGLGETTVIS
jgi:hypothetical protein